MPDVIGLEYIYVCTCSSACFVYVQALRALNSFGGRIHRV